MKKNKYVKVSYVFILGAFWAPQFSFAQLSEINVSEAEEMIVLTPAKIDDSQKFFEEQKNKKSTSDGSSAAQMSRQGDSNAASALKRITGVTIVDDKYAVIRGLGERYSSTRLNGYFLPSLEPNKRQFALNIFPTGALSGIEVEKSYLTSWPSSFAGGLVNLKTDSEVASKVFKVQVGFGIEENSEKFYTSQNSNSDFLSDNLNNRKIPNKIKNALESGRLLVEASPSQPNGFTKVELVEFSKAMPKNYNLNTDRQSSVIPQLQIQGGSEMKNSYFSLSNLSTFSYKQGAQSENYQRKNFDISSGTNLTFSDLSQVEKFKIEKALSVQTSNKILFTNSHNLKFDLYGIRNGSESAQVQEKNGPGMNDYLRKVTSIEFKQRTLLGLSLTDTFAFSKKHRLKTGVANHQVTSLNPDAREYTYRQRSQSDSLDFDSEASGNLRSWNELNENSDEFKFEYLYGEDEKNPEFTLGVNNLHRNRITKTSRFQFIKNFAAGESPDLKRSLDEVFSEDGSWILINQTQNADAYSALSEQSAVYYTFSYPILSDLVFYGGHRFENNFIQVDNRNSFTGLVDSGSNTQMESLLTSLSLIYNQSKFQKVIFAFGETLMTPDFRELTSVRYYDDEEGLEAKGNIGLKPTEMKSFDIRTEFYPQAEEVLSFGIFAKQFSNPIEDTYLPIAGGVVRYPQNVAGASLYGVEGEIRLSARKWMRDLRFVNLSLNGSLIKSEVQILPGQEGALTNTRRSMQGQSDWILNSEVYYQRNPKGLLLSLSLNVAGPRIFAVGTEGRPDTIEKEFIQMDLSSSYQIRDSGKVSFRVKNILDSEKKLMMGPEQSFTQKNGPEFGISYSETL